MDFVIIDGVVHVHQHSYIENLQPIHLQGARSKSDEPGWGILIVQCLLVSGLVDDLKGDLFIYLF